VDCQQDSATTRGGLAAHSFHVLLWQPRSMVPYCAILLPAPLGWIHSRASLPAVDRPAQTDGDTETMAGCAGRKVNQARKEEANGRYQSGSLSAFSANGSWLCWSSSRGVQFSDSPREASAGCVPSGRMREIT